MKNIFKFKSKKQLFEEWWQEVYVANFKNQDIKSALIIYETADEKGEPLASHCRFNCDMTNLQWFNRCLGEKIKEMEFDKFMKEHINEYIEYID